MALPSASAGPGMDEQAYQSAMQELTAKSRSLDHMDDDYKMPLPLDFKQDRNQEAGDVAKQFKEVDKEVDAREMRKNLLNFHKHADTMEAQADRYWEQSIIASSAKEAAEATYKADGSQQKDCLAECLHMFHGSLRTCSRQRPRTRPMAPNRRTASRSAFTCSTGRC